MNYDKHNAETLKHIREVQRIMGRALRTLSDLQDNHDNSKLESPEREVYAEALPRLAGTSYGTPEYSALLESIKPALDHHYSVNRHHPECHEVGIRGMSLFDLVEMICDWCAAVKRHSDGDILASIAKNQTRFGYSDELRDILLNTVYELGEVPPAKEGIV